MIDSRKILQHIKSLTPEEWNSIMKKSLDEAGISYSETLDKPGEIIFNGLLQDPDLLTETTLQSD